MLVAASLRVVGIGLLLGGFGAAAIRRVIQSGYHGIERMDVVAFGGAVVLFLANDAPGERHPCPASSKARPRQKLKEA